jgi:phosphoglycolate phosphatase-like HAD superfamily hydrolase
MSKLGAPCLPQAPSSVASHGGPGVPERRRPDDRTEHAMTARSVPLIQGLSEIADDYDALLLDQWGVLHGGVEPYPGVLETLAALRDAGKPVAVLSNAPRRSEHAEGRMRQIGVPAEPRAGRKPAVIPCRTRSN